MSIIKKVVEGECCVNQERCFQCAPDHALFELREEHIKLAEQLSFRIAIDLFEEGRWYVPVIDEEKPLKDYDVMCAALDILQIEPLNGDDSFTYEQEEEVWKLIIGLPVALEIIMKHRTFTPGIYEVNKNDTCYHEYKKAKNHLMLRKPLLKCRDFTTPYDENNLKIIDDFCRNSYADDPYVDVLERDWGAKKNIPYFKKVKEVFQKYHEQYLKEQDWSVLFTKDGEVNE